MSSYEVSEQFKRSCNFLRVRSYPSTNSVSNVMYAIANEDFANTSFTVDLSVGVDPRYRGWFRVEKVRLPGGDVKEGGWVVKEWRDVPTLVPEASIEVADGDSSESARSHASDHASRVLKSRPDANLNAQYVKDEALETDNAVLAWSDGTIAWKYRSDVKLGSLVVRVVERRVVVAQAGRGLDIVRKMEDECVRADPFNTGRRPDVVIFFLHSVLGAEDSHAKHGYKGLWRNEGMVVMYRQIAGGNHFGGKSLTDIQVSNLCREYFPPADDVKDLNGKWLVKWKNGKSESIELKSGSFQCFGTKYSLSQLAPATFRWPDGTLQTATDRRSRTIVWLTSSSEEIVWTKA